MKRLLLIPPLLFVGCAKQEVVKTKTVYESTKVVRIVPHGTISQDQCSKVPKGTTMRSVIDRYGWPHTQRIDNALNNLAGDTLSYPFSENSTGYCALKFDGRSFDPDKTKLTTTSIVLK